MNRNLLMRKIEGIRFFSAILALSIPIITLGVLTSARSEFSSCASCRNQQAQPMVYFCDLLSQPRRFRNRRVRTEAIALITFESQMLYDVNCTSDLKLTHLQTQNVLVADELSRVLGNPLTGPKRVKLTVEGQIQGPSQRGYGHLNFARFRF